MAGKEKQPDGIYVVGTRQKMYEARWKVKVDGKWKDRSRILGPVAAMTKAEAKEKRRKVIDREKGADAKLDTESTFAELWARYVAAQRTWGTAHRGNMRNMFANHVLSFRAKSWPMAFGEMMIGEISKAHVQTLINHLTDQGLSLSLIRKVRVYLKATFEEALDEEVIGRNPARKPKAVSIQEKTSRFLTIEEVASLLAKSYGRDHLILRLALVCGFRPSELFALRWNDIEPGRIRVDEAASSFRQAEGLTKRPKTERSKAWVSVPPSVMAELAAWRRMSFQGDDQFVFPSARNTPIDRGNYLRRILAPIAAAAGVPGVNFQTLRRTCATYLNQAGNIKDAQAQLRHTNPNLTASVYAQSVPESVRQAVEALDRRLFGQESPAVQ